MAATARRWRTMATASPTLLDHQCNFRYEN